MTMSTAIVHLPTLGTYHSLIRHNSPHAHSTILTPPVYHCHDRYRECVRELMCRTAGWPWLSTQVMAWGFGLRRSTKHVQVWTMVLGDGEAAVHVKLSGHKLCGSQRHKKGIELVASTSLVASFLGNHTSMSFVKGPHLTAGSLIEEWD